MSEEPRRASSILGPPAAVTARVVGILCIASGFVVGIEGLSRPSSGWLRTALALIVTGLVAQVFALYARVRSRRERDQRGQEGD